jgi:uncharacterized protein YfbU (UPF0304 family)
MFRALGKSYDALLDKSGIDQSLIRFDGFDDRNESEYLRIARELATCHRDIEVFNSHMPRLQSYQKMVQAWRVFQDKENLTKNDILRIIH